MLTECWIGVREGVTTLAPPHCLVGDEWTRITALFNHEMGEGQHRLLSEIMNKWMDVKEKVVWFNRWYNYIKNTKNYYADGEELLDIAKEFYILEHEGTDFEYEDVWNVVKLNRHFI